ncbi:MAG: glycosyltransferase family 4 protein [Bacteroidetes bacterium]|nr:glycosyltransferase family 4 protein [Bacteroidota bacterium]
MKLVCITYTRKTQFSDPMAWLRRVRGYAGLLEALAQKDTVISIDRIDYTGDITVNNVRHIFPHTGTSRLSSAWRLNRLARRLDPDVVLIQGMIFPVQTILLRLQLPRHTKIIVQNHAEKAGTGRRRLLQQMADPAIDAYLFTAKEMGDEWLRHHIIRQPQKIRQVMEASSVFSPGDTQVARTRLHIDGAPLFLWVGRLDTNKDPLTVLTAFLDFTRQCPGARLFMLFHTRELLQDINTLLDSTPGAGEKITLVGEKTHEEMEDWFHAADYIISGSHYEGSGVAVCEAMSCGCIPILTDILSFRMMTGNGACGILYPPGDSKALTRALIQITSQPLSGEKERTILQFKKQLSFEAIATTIHDIAASLQSP